MEKMKQNISDANCSINKSSFEKLRMVLVIAPMKLRYFLIKSGGGDLKLKKQCFYPKIPIFETRDELEKKTPLKIQILSLRIS